MSADNPPAPSFRRTFLRRWFKPLVFALCLVPLALLVFRAFTNDLSANPVEFIIRYLGDWALRFLLIALAVTPVRVLTGWIEVARLRRMLGLFAFTYVVLHLLAYTGIDQGVDLAGLFNDVVKRIYITVGLAAFGLVLGYSEPDATFPLLAVAAFPGFIGVAFIVIAMMGRTKV